MKYPGRYIVIEGIDGAGKDTQVEYMKTLLPKDTVYTREPRGTEMGKKLRDIIVTTELDPVTEILLFYAARKELVKDVILPALKEGKTVVSNRNELTTYAYQIHARERQDLLELTNYLSDQVLGEVQPDLAIYFDITADIKKKRLLGRQDQLDSFDKLAEDFFERARIGYKRYITKYPHVIIDASGTIEEVQVKTKQAIQEFLKK